jgi:hypothetical protein
MANTAKVANYTAEQTALLVSEYNAGTAVEAIAVMVGHSVRSVIAKLSREKVYVAKAKTKAEAKVTKAELIAKIEVAFGVEAGSMASLEKAAKEVLETLAG